MKEILDRGNPSLNRRLYYCKDGSLISLSSIKGIDFSFKIISNEQDEVIPHFRILKDEDGNVFKTTQRQIDVAKRDLADTEGIKYCVVYCIGDGLKNK